MKKESLWRMLQGYPISDETREKIVAPLEAEWKDYVDYVLDAIQRLSSGIFNIISQGFTNLFIQYCKE